MKILLRKIWNVTNLLIISSFHSRLCVLLCPISWHIGSFPAWLHQLQPYLMSNEDLHGLSFYPLGKLDIHSLKHSYSLGYFHSPENYFIEFFCCCKIPLSPVTIGPQDTNPVYSADDNCLSLDVLPNLNSYCLWRFDLCKCLMLMFTFVTATDKFSWYCHPPPHPITVTASFMNLRLTLRHRA